MGKPKLKSTMKALHNAIFGFKPPGSKTTTWVCVQQAKTESFREVYKSFNSMYYSTSTTSSDLCTLNEETDPQESGHTLSTQPSGEESFSTSSTSSLTTEWTDSHPTELVLKGFISSRRFFFSPCTTKSIMEEAHVLVEEENKMGLQEAAIPCNRCVETEESVECGTTMTMEIDFCKKSMMMAMASHNPYMDFRVSMEEMVEAHGLREWSRLQELLHCYLRLNDQTTHKTIFLAFVDLIMNLLNEEPSKVSNSSITISSNVNKERCFPLSLPTPLCLDL